MKQENRDLFGYLSVVLNTPNSFCLSLHVVNWETTESHWTVLSGTISNLFQHNNITSVFKDCVEAMQDHTASNTASRKQGFFFFKVALKPINSLIQLSDVWIPIFTHFHIIGFACPPSVCSVGQTGCMNSSQLCQHVKETWP